MNRVTPERIKILYRNEIFVFGSNESGIHGAGAAYLAQQKFGAKKGVGFGPTGQCFAIPTKDWNIRTLPLVAVKAYVDAFIRWADTQKGSGDRIYVTEIGCGLAGFTPEQIAPLFRRCLKQDNVYLPQRFIDILIK